ncbi:hypothetical protein [Nocardia sp. NPDC004860]|uniref:hypothetical protein n=1 Tax=Nocardia sp. NPDC004860 TaxID=3154557 RepID=UPI0033B9ED28
MQDNDAGAETIRGYLTALLRQLWEHGENFGGKRPFGNSGWEYDLYRTLAGAGLIEATLDDEGFLDTCDDRTGHELIAQAITALGATGQSA